MAITKCWKGICADPQKGYNKYYYLEMRDDGSVYARWGKVVEGCEDKDPLKHMGHGEAAYEKKLREKRNQDPKKGTYVEVPVLDNAAVKTAGVGTGNTNLIEAAIDDIKFTSQVVETLIRRLVTANIHNITANTAITINKTTGLPQTPLGPLTDDGLRLARNAHARVAEFVAALGAGKKIDLGDFDNAVLEYIRIVPQDMGRITRFEPHSIFPDFAAVDKQTGILDSLESTLQIIKSAPKDDQPVTVQRAPLFNLTMDLCEDKKEIQRVRDFFNKTRNSIHAASRLDVHAVYHVNIGHMSEAFEAKGRGLGTVWELWHGTRIGNLLSILKGGYYVPPSNAPHVTGRMFGNGMYFSDQSTKSLNYAMGYAPGQRGGYSAECFMFLNEVAMGKYHVPNGPGSHFPVKGYDSTFAQAGKSGVMNNEMIVPHTYQCNPTLLIEFR